MADLNIDIKLKVRRGRLRSMTERLAADIRRCPKRDRQALVTRRVRQIVDACVIMPPAFTYSEVAPRVEHVKNRSYTR